MVIVECIEDGFVGRESESRGSVVPYRLHRHRREKSSKMVVICVGRVCRIVHDFVLAAMVVYLMCIFPFGGRVAGGGVVLLAA